MAKPYVYIVGIRGNMASRYIAILNHLKVPYTGHDIGGKFSDDAHRVTHFIIASPTEEHLRHVGEAFRFQKPILCEKPLTHCMAKLAEFEEKHHLNMGMLSMVNQYAHMPLGDHQGESFYDYFKSGNDGLVWDCINIIGLADSKPILDKKSPIWNCQINGKKLKISDMDFAYISMISEWLKNPKSNYAYARRAHEKVVDWCKS